MNRPKKPKNYKQDGDDYNTCTKYATEYCVGDALKVILLQIYDMVEYENLQVAEIKALINCLVDEHIFEVDEAEDM